MRVAALEQHPALSSSIKKGAKKTSAEQLAKWSCSSNEVINLKIIEEEDELFTESGYFHPVYTNQVQIFPLIRVGFQR